MWFQYWHGILISSWFCILFTLSFDWNLMLGTKMNTERLSEGRNLHCLQYQSSTSYHFAAKAAWTQMGAFGWHRQACTLWYSLCWSPRKRYCTETVQSLPRRKYVPYAKLFFHRSITLTRRRCLAQNSRAYSNPCVYLSCSLKQLEKPV